MPNYAFIDSNNVVKELLWFDEPQDDLTPFIEVQKQILGEEELSAVEVKDHHHFYSAGNVWVANDNEFRPAQPYPSWIWDPNKFLWRPPVIHPDVFPGLENEDNKYQWNEENQSWDPK